MATTQIAGLDRSSGGNPFPPILLDNDPTFAANSDSNVPSQKAIKTALTKGNVPGTVVASGSATVTLIGGQAGGTFLLDAATGVAYTLPVPVAGMKFKFVVTVTATSNQHKIVTDSAATFLQGSVIHALEATTPGANPGPKIFSGNGTTHTKFNMEGTANTTGGVKGTQLDFLAISATVWQVTGINECAGTIATPFQTGT